MVTIGYSKCSLNKLLFDLVTHLGSSDFIIFLLLLSFFFNVRSELINYNCTDIFTPIAV